jgi:hypothetical protein
VRLLLCLLLACVFSAQALAQRHGGPGARTSNLSPDQRRQLRQDVDSARGAYQRPGGPRQDRMAPQDREKLRRDVQDANKDMRRR